MNLDFTNKNVLITGGSRGIGAACVKMFSQSNANVAFTYSKNKKDAEKLIINTKNRNPIRAYKLNLNNTKSIEKQVKQIIKDFGKIDILINNAGIWKEAEADKMTLKQWEETIRINLTGTFNITKLVLPLMKKNKFGRIINISSTAGQRGEPFHSHYAASKGGMISFTKSLAAEVGKFNITANSVAPGWVTTDMTIDTLKNKKLHTKIKNEIPTNKIADPEDIAGPVLFIASDFAKQINGEILNVNGGSVLCG